MTNPTISIAALVERVKIVVTDPSGCWSVVSADTRDAKALFKDFAAPMEVLGGLVTFIASVLFGVMSAMGVKFAVFQLVTLVIGGCVSGLVMAFIATKVASFVGGSVTFDRAYSWVVHASMVGFVANLIGVLPYIGFLFAFAGSIGTIYWGWTGIPAMVNVPTEKRGLFFGGTILLSIFALMVVWFVLGGALIGSAGVMAAGQVTP
jgi:hypothetical protein